MPTFDLAIAQSLYDSNDRFPVDFDDAWKWLGYSRKDSALRSFLSSEFEVDLDFAILHIDVEYSDRGVGQPSVDYRLTIDCLKTFAMMAKTEQGKQVRRYFLECEKSHKESAQTIAALRVEIAALRAVASPQTATIAEKAEASLHALLDRLPFCQNDPYTTGQITRSIAVLREVVGKTRTAGPATQPPIPQLSGIAVRIDPIAAVEEEFTSIAEYAQSRRIVIATRSQLSKLNKKVWALCREERIPPRTSLKGVVAPRRIIAAAFAYCCW